jgi:hypothetical protein
VGGSYNWTHFDQSLQGVSGVINVFDGPLLIAQGQEGGPFFDFNRNKSGFAPDVQLGYMHPIAGGDWLAGLKFNYKYANIDSNQNVSIPQNGTGTVLSGPQAGLTGPITGFVAISPAEINLKHQLSLIATIGRAFDNVTLYAGGGPALFGVQTNFINGIPFATSSLGGTFPASEPTTVFNENWVWGGAGWCHLCFRWRLVLRFCLHLCAIRELHHRRSGHCSQPNGAVEGLWFCCPQRSRAGLQPIRDADAQL